MLPYTPAIVAEALLMVLDQAAAHRGRCTLAIPGGRSPGPVLSELARLCTPFVRSRLHLLWLDERAVPRGHHDRNDAAGLAAWATGGPLPQHVHPMPAESGDLDAAAAAYATTLAEACAGGPLDACLVGLGEDGHVASLFPGHPALRDLDPVLALRDSPKPPPCRLSLGLGTIRCAGIKALLVLGAAKGRICAAARCGPDPTLPCSLLGDNCLWYLDREAAEAACA